MGCRLRLLYILRSVGLFVGKEGKSQENGKRGFDVLIDSTRIFSFCHQSDSEEMNEIYSTQQAEDNDYLPRNDEFIPPTNFAVIEKGLYRSIHYFLTNIEGAFPVKRNFPFLKHLGIRSILYVLLYA